MSFITRLTFHKSNAIEIHNIQIKQLEVAVLLSVFSFFCAEGRLSELELEQLEKKRELESSLPLGVTVLI